MILRTLLASLALVLSLSGVAAAQTLDPALPNYEKTSGVGGTLNSVGSDTLNNLMTLWGEGIHELYPQVKPQIEGKGSSTAPPALISGTAQLGPMSRKMKDKEIAAFEKVFGYPPTPVAVAVDGLAVFVNKDSTLEKLTLQQVDAIFSKTRKGGFKNAIDSWTEIGGPDKPISLYGRNSASGTYGFFKSVALFKGDFKDTVKEQPGSAAVVQGVAEDITGIGYSGLGYRTSGVKTVALAKNEGSEYYSPDNPQNVLTGKYPLSRFLYVYVNKAPGKPLDPTVREFLRYVLSRQGQEAVIEDGYLPLSSKFVAKQLKDLGL